jgi:hypothetical protein
VKKAIGNEGMDVRVKIEVFAKSVEGVGCIRTDAAFQRLTE